MSNFNDLINETQDLVLRGWASDCQRVDLPTWIQNIKTIRDAPDSAIECLLGNLGKGMKRFSVRVNLNHPDVESYLSKEVVEMFAAAAKAVAENSKMQSKDDWLRCVRILFSPPSRLLHQEERKNQREIKKQVKNISLKNLQGGLNAENLYFGQARNFNRFARRSKFYIEEMKDFQARREFFISKQMNEIAGVFDKRMRSLEESITEVMGFYPLKPDDAAVVLAQFHDFSWNESGTITVPIRYYNNNRFWTDGKVNNEVEELKKGIVLNTRFVPSNGFSFFTYQPRMYPLTCYPLRLSDKAQKIIDWTECLPELNNNPFFDYFWVLVPSISIDNTLIQKNKGHWTIFNRGETIIYTDANEASIALDKQLIENELAAPIVIGERNGRCYFVCMTGRK